ncbi:MAG: hypothetical protein IJT54_06485 [Candidatus Methanomethylophilaceae archaeon]|nr:hypothetical protein [Candidatus Methanomethylophilaceae archaeon]
MSRSGRNPGLRQFIRNISHEDAGEDVETDRVKKIRLAYAKELARNDKI